MEREKDVGEIGSKRTGQTGGRRREALLGEGGSSLLDGWTP